VPNWAEERNKYDCSEQENISNRAALWEREKQADNGQTDAIILDNGRAVVLMLAAS
jgi:hypothetical protein